MKLQGKTDVYCMQCKSVVGFAKVHFCNEIKEELQFLGFHSFG
jgi:hypothetical protein